MPTGVVYGLAWGVVAGALLHFGVQVPGLRRTGMKYSFRLNLRDEGATKVGKLILPRIVGQAGFPANVIALTSIASLLAAGSVGASPGAGAGWGGPALQQGRDISRLPHSGGRRSC